MDMRIIEVAIGLILVFALTSLLVSTVHEIWSSYRGQRGDSLLMGVCSLLGDNQVTVGKLRRDLFASKRPSAFTNDLMAHPLIVSQVLGGPEKKNMPSYLPSDVFVNALLDHLSAMNTEGLRLSTPREWINAVTAGLDAKTKPGNEHQPSPALVQSLASLVHGVADDWPSYEQRLRAWYDSVMVRAGGWYKRDTQLRLAILGTALAAIVNINPLVIGPRLWNDPVLRQATFALADQAVKGYAAANADAASGQQGVASSASAVAPAAVAQAASGARRAARAPQGAASAATAAQSPETLETDQALLAFNEALSAVANSWPAKEAAQEANLPETTRKLLWSLQKQVELRRLFAKDPRGVLMVFDGSTIIENQLGTLTENAKGLDIGTDFVRLSNALFAERDSLLPPSALARRGGGAAPSPERAAQVADVCVGEITDEAIQRLCEPLAAINSLAQAGLPLGWRWSNWPLCDGQCQLRHRSESSVETDDPLTVAAEPAGMKDDYRLTLELSRERCAQAPAGTCVGDGAASDAGRDRASAARLRSLYLSSRTALTRAMEYSDAPQWDPWKALVKLVGSRDVWHGVWFALFGWLMVGIASTLGAPFWFDLLGRFVKLRGSGAPAPASSTDASGGAASTAADTMTRPSGPAPSGGGTTASAKDSALSNAPADTGAMNAAERELTVETIVRLQASLGLVGTETSGKLDAATRGAIVAWQNKRGDAVADGQLTAAQIGTLLAVVAPAAATPGATPIVSATPRRANNTINVLSESQLRALYGDIATTPLAGGNAKVEREGIPGMPQRVLVNFSHTALPTSTGTLRVHERAAPHFKAVFDAIQSRGLAGLIIECGGTLSERHIGNDPSKPLSRHTWAIAIDLNNTANPMYQAPVPAGQPGSVLELVGCFNEFGFAWGGHFSSGVDAMHFELALRDPLQPPIGRP